jgi:signal transduction histidine kinase
VSFLPRPWLLGAAPRRALAEAGVASLALALLLYVAVLVIPAPPGRIAVLRPGLLYVALVGAVFSALRLRRAGGGRWRRAGREFGALAALALTAWAGVWLFDAVASALLGPAAGGNGDGGPLQARIDEAVQGGILAAFAAVLSALAYAAARNLALAWAAWNRLRRTRLLWSLTHAMLVVAVGLAVALAAVVTALDARARSQVGVQLPASEDAGGALAQVLDRIIASTAILLVFSAAAVLVVLPPTALLALAVLRPVTRRLEDLAAATGALRAGQLAARVPIAGMDEVARLQADFNAMAADLERVVGDLQAERDTVARLLQIRRELAAAVSHDLRTPVATLRGYLDSAIEHWDGAPPPTLRHDLEVMAGETEHLQRLVEDLFTLSRAEIGGLPLALAPTDVGALLHRCAAAAAPLAWERGRVEVLAEAPPGQTWAQADERRLDQVVRNLVANAVRHTPAGGLVLLTASAAGGTVIVQVKDTGEGIPPEDLPRVWERFYRSGTARSRDQGGAGLGLALVKELTEAMGGSVDVESAVNQGSTFTLRLPAA